MWPLFIVWVRGDMPISLWVSGMAVHTFWRVCKLQCCWQTVVLQLFKGKDLHYLSFNFLFMKTKSSQSCHLLITNLLYHMCNLSCGVFICVHFLLSDTSKFWHFFTRSDFPVFWSTWSLPWPAKTINFLSHDRKEAFLGQAGSSYWKRAYFVWVWTPDILIFNILSPTSSFHSPKIVSLFLPVLLLISHCSHQTAAPERGTPHGVRTISGGCSVKLLCVQIWEDFHFALLKSSLEQPCCTFFTSHKHHHPVWFLCTAIERLNKAIAVLIQTVLAPWELKQN